MKNRVDKLLKEKRRALSQIKIAKNRSLFIKKVNTSKTRDQMEKEHFRQMMRQKLKDQQELNAKKRRELKDSIYNSRLAKIEENRGKKNFELETKKMKKLEKFDNDTVFNNRVQGLRDTINSHRK